MIMSGRAVHSIALACGAALAALPSLPPALGAQALDYPVTRRDTVVDDYFGSRVPAPYRWLEDTASTGVHGWVNAQVALTSRYLASLPLRSWIAGRIRSASATRHVQGYVWRERDQLFYALPAASQASLEVVTRTDDGAPVTVLDGAARWPDGSMQITNYRPTRDGRYLGYQLRDAATGAYAFHVLDLRTGRDLADTVANVDRFSSISFTLDGKGFVYDRPRPGAAPDPTIDDDAYYHVLGTPQSEDIMLHGHEADRGVAGGITASGRYLIINVWSTRRPVNRLYYADLGDPHHPDLHAPLHPLLARDDAQYIWLREVNDSLYILTTGGASGRRVIAIPLGGGPDPEPRVVLPEGREPMQEATIVGGWLAVLDSHDVASRIRLFTLEGRPAGEVTLPGVGTASNLGGKKDVAELFYQFASTGRPRAWYRYDIERGTTEPVVGTGGGALEADQFETRRVFYTSADGTRVPLLITARKGIELDGSHPMVLAAYGAVGFNMSVQAVPGAAALPAWLQLGGVYAQAAVRGGGEYGEAWHRAGMRDRKQNGIDDLISAAEYLEDAGYTAPEHLAVVGLRAGGLLIAAALTQRPELFAAAYVRQGVLDPLRYERASQDSILVPELGSVRDSTAFAYLYQYAPLPHVHPGACYPATLVSVDAGSPRAPQAYTLIAALQRVQPCDHPILLQVQAGGGGAPANGIDRDAEAWAFLARATGMGRVPPDHGGS